MLRFYLLICTYVNRQICQLSAEQTLIDWLFADGVYNVQGCFRHVDLPEISGTSVCDFAKMTKRCIEYTDVSIAFFSKSAWS